MMVILQKKFHRLANADLKDTGSEDTETEEM